MIPSTIPASAVLAALAAHLACAPAGAAQSGAPQFGWRRTGTSVALTAGDAVVWRFNHGPGHPKPCFHPLATTDGTVLTDLRPADHPWHRSGWFSFKFIDGVNYWEEDRAGVAAGVTETVEVDVRTNADFSAVIDARLSYHPPGAGEVLAERRRIEVSAPDEQGSYTMDWQLLFTARRDSKLDRTPLPGQPGGKGYGGYAGLSLRLAKRTGGWAFLDDRGRTEGTHGSSSTWLAFRGALPGGSAGIAIFDHPSNPTFPTRWFVAPGMPYFSPAFLFDGPLQLAAGQHLGLFYRVKVYGRSPDTAVLRSDYRGFADRVFALTAGLTAGAAAGERVDLVALGRELFQVNCTACHSSLKGGEAGKLGPGLYGLIGKRIQRREVCVRPGPDSLQPGAVESVLADEAYVRHSILEPTRHLAVRRSGAQAGEAYPPAMPPFLHLEAQQIQALTAYLKTLNDPGERGPAEVLAYPRLEPSASFDRFEVVVRDRPLVYRVAMAGVSTRAIAVGLPGGHSYVFDPSTFSVRQAWGGGFLDLRAERTGRGRGTNGPVARGYRHLGFAECLRPLGPSGPVDHDYKDYVNDPRWRQRMAAAEAGVAIPFAERRPRDDARFSGYLLRGTEPPTFLFSIDGVDYAQQLFFETDRRLHFRFAIQGATRPVRFAVREDRVRAVHSTAGELRDGVLSIPAESAGGFTVSMILDPRLIPEAPEHGGDDRVQSLRERLGLAGRVNLARGARAESDGEKDHAAIGPGGAVDGDPATYWDETDSRPSYRLKITLREPAMVSAAAILGYQHHHYAPKDFELVVDGRVVQRVTDATYDHNLLLVPFPRTRCGVLELRVTGCYGRSPAVRELELFDLGPMK